MKNRKVSESLPFGSPGLLINQTPPANLNVTSGLAPFNYSNEKPLYDLSEGSELLILSDSFKGSENSPDNIALCHDEGRHDIIWEFAIPEESYPFKWYSFYGMNRADRYNLLAVEDSAIKYEDSDARASSCCLNFTTMTYMNQWK